MNSLPPFVLNTLPKSGTHLTLQILLSNTLISYNPKKFLLNGLPNQIQGFHDILKQASPNELLTAHLWYTPSIENLFIKLNIKQIYIYRDLRDVLVSFAYFIDKAPSGIAISYLKSLPIRERLLVLINGTKNPLWPDFNNYFAPFLGWEKSPVTFPVTYEELVSSAISRHNAIKSILDYLWEDLIPPVPIEKMIKAAENNINPSSCPTFRKGKIGSWRDEFDDEIKTAFKNKAGEHLINLGYEKDNNW
ncbi:sulfotransferase domain-containing protein [Bacillus benzoevorans]|uniref:Sulfotransferase domain-containing protein n=1 Tax=Bacillus benzoevorans TaxID=1456 RepID=A0A7X0LWD4_9BACI|nr:sulfotransferase domain-containing protein [Bacillus benzoevorans]MBB6445229.1 hypothetical protein [Bacillus benzoevorans]